MIADTDAELRRRLHTRLQDFDIFSDCVSTAVDAYEKLNESQYALVVADVGLPGSGIDHVIGRIARLERNRRPIVLVLAATVEAAKTLDVEIVQIVLRRPVEISKLADLIRSCIRSAGTSQRGEPEGEGRPARGQPIS